MPELNLKHVMLVFQKKQETQEARDCGEISDSTIISHDLVCSTYNFKGWNSAWFNNDVIERIKSSAVDIVSEAGNDKIDPEEDELVFMFSVESDNYYLKEGIEQIMSPNKELCMDIDTILKNKENMLPIFESKDKEYFEKNDFSDL